MTSEAEASTLSPPKLEVVLSSAAPLRVKELEVASCLTPLIWILLLARPMADTMSAYLPLVTVLTAWSKKLVDMRLLADR